jgi:collagenase-like PrtC family protease
MNEKDFCVPYNGDIELVKEALKYKNNIYEFYGTDGKFISGRETLNTVTDFEKTIILLRKNNIKFNYLFNSLNIVYYNDNLKEIKQHLKYLKQLKVDSITCTSPFIAEIAKTFKFQIISSTNQFIDTETKVNYLIELGYDRILVAEDIQRHINKLKYLNSLSSIPFEVMVNNLCLLDCPFRLTHQCSLQYEFKNDELDTYISRNCTSYKNVLNLLKSSYIRPVDVDVYRKLGIKYFKIAGRTSTTQNILKFIDIYVNKKPMNLRELDSRFYTDLNSEKLNEFYQFFWDEKCEGRCSICGHCNKWADILQS